MPILYSTDRPVSSEVGVDGSLEVLAQQLHFVAVAHQRHHNFGMDGHSLGGDVAGRRDYRAGLHLVDGRELEAEPAAAQTQHRVDLPQLLQVGKQGRLGGKGLGRTAGGPKFHHVLQNLDEAGQKLVERRVQQPDHRGPALQHPEYRLEICNLIAFQNGKTGVEIPVALALRTVSAVVGRENHRPHHVQALRLEEHVLGATKANALCAELERGPHVSRIVGVRPHAQPLGVVGPRQQLHHVLLAGNGWLQGGYLATEYLARRAVYADVLTLGHDHAVALDVPAFGIYRQGLGAGDAGLAQAAGNDRSMARRAAPARDDAHRGQHPVHVLRAGLGPREHHANTLVGEPLRLVGVERQAARGSARRRAETDGDESPLRARRLRGALVESRNQQIVHLVGINPLQRLLPRDEPLARPSRRPCAQPPSGFAARSASAAGTACRSRP